MELLRLLGPAVLAFAAAALCDLETARRGLTPPLFREPWRRGLAVSALAVTLYFGIFLSLSAVGLETELDPSTLGTFDLFALHAVFLLCLAAWYGLGFGGLYGAVGWIRQYGFRSAEPFREIGLGLAAGVAGWVLVMTVMVVVALLTFAVGGEESLPTAPPDTIAWLVGLPALLRLAVSFSAGFTEEVFFRGFLQPRVGIVLSSLFFVLAHASYESPFMLIGIALLSLFFAGLVQWRQNVLAAIVAHATFDAVQLLAVIPSALEMLESQGLLDETVIAALRVC